MNNLKLEQAIKFIPTRVRAIKELDVLNLLEAPSKTSERNDRTWSYTVFAKKHYKDWRDKVVKYNPIFNHPPLPETELFSTVLKSNEKKDYFGDDTEEQPTELVGYDYADYRMRTDIKKPEQIIEDLLFAGSLNFEFGQKGVGKSEFILGTINALVRGQDFLMFGIPRAHPVVYMDAEMHPYDTISRNEPYYKKYARAPLPNYLTILNWFDQKDHYFPDIQTEVGQKLILKYLQKVEKLTGKKPVFVLDNLRSASAYNENESDSWRPIGVWLKKLAHGLNYTVIVIDHSGKSVEAEMRGTSAKGDHANVCLQILSEKKKGGLMRIKVKFAKARGLRPDQTDDFVCQYDFQGNWSLAASDKEQEDEALKEELKKLLPKNWTQKAMAKELGIAVGKVNKLLKEIEVK